MNAGPTRFAVVGDATLDVTVRSPATPTAGSDRTAGITLGPGGQGANMAVRLARRGAQVSLITAIADDRAGEQLKAALAEDGVALVELPAVQTGVVVSLVNASGERAMLSDRVSLDPAGLRSPAVRAAVGDADWIHVSGYPLADPASGGALAVLVAGRRAGQVCSVGGGSFGAGSDMPARLRTIRPELVLFDRAEASAILAGHPAELLEDLAAALVSAMGGTALVTDGAAGAAGATGDGTVAVSGWPGSAVDATGAGDAFGAGMLLALADGEWPPPLPALRAALEQASRLGAEVAGVVGSQARVASES
ncbi:MAG: carbohydrate kinase family protein [Candidatus Limnocylindria bacterium]